MSGPFETEQQARELPAVRAVHEACAAAPGVGRMAPHNKQMLEDACTDAGVAAGAYDRRILAWLAGWEPQTCAVIAGLITRAHAAAPRSASAVEDAARQVLAAWDSGEADWDSAGPGSLTAAVRGLRAALRDGLYSTASGTGARLNALAGWMEERLGDEEYDRQAVAESGVTQIREIARLASGATSVVTLSAAQAETVRQALADAIEWRDPRGGTGCDDCLALDEGGEWPRMCDDHDADQAAVHAYRDLAADLGEAAS
ncbi:MAG TPA: hypothetical protein VLW50_34460 [Streptosporangiaceae bacterium]|nr:hypothetical protein [Streptosporangiaceae bacterium]